MDANIQIAAGAASWYNPSCVCVSSVCVAAALLRITAAPTITSNRSSIRHLLYAIYYILKEGFIVWACGGHRRIGHCLGGLYLPIAIYIYLWIYPPHTHTLRPHIRGRIGGGFNLHFIYTYIEREYTCILCNYICLAFALHCIAITYR